MIAMLRMIKEHGGTDCTGTCHHRKPGEFHCHVFGRMLKLSSHGIRTRVIKLVNMGLLERNRIKRDNGSLLVKYTITRAGEDLLLTSGRKS